MRDRCRRLLAARRATMGLLSPAEGINYNFILGMYSFFLALGALFAAVIHPNFK